MRASLSRPELQSLPWGGGPEAYHLAIGGERNPFCLASGGEGRFSYLGHNPHVMVRMFPDRLEATWGNKTEVFHENPFSWLPSFSPLKQGPSAFLASGWVGFLGYEMAPFADPSFPKRDLPRDILIGAFGLYDPILVFDHSKNQAWVASWGITDDLGLDKKLAKERIKDVIRIPFEERGKNPPRALGGSPSTLRQDSEQALLGAGFAVAQDDRVIKSNLTQTKYESAVQRILEYIRAGDCYQVNMTQQFLFGWDRDWEKIPYFWEKARAHPSDFAAFLDFDSLQILSFSPEELLKIQGKQIETCPIKGTRGRSKGPFEDRAIIEELRQAPKDASELLMIVDLERNDLGKVCRPGSVTVPRLKEVKTLDYVHHLRATVQGELREGVSTMEALRALFPGGSITGAPKRRAMEIIQELEPDPRGPYTGAIGFMDFSGLSLFNLAIRTLEVREGVARFGVGGGIVAESDPKAEYEETMTKAKVFLE